MQEKNNVITLKEIIALDANWNIWDKVEVIEVVEVLSGWFEVVQHCKPLLIICLTVQEKYVLLIRKLKFVCYVVDVKHISKQDNIICSLLLCNSFIF